MIATLMRINWLNLKRDYVALGLTFVLPIVFFSIFAVIFGGLGGGGGGGGGGDEAMDVIVVDLDGTDVSRRFVEAVDEQDALDVTSLMPAGEDGDPARPYTRDEARRAVRSGVAPAAIVVPPGFGATFGDLSGEADSVEVIYDSANPLAQHTVAGLIQASAMMAAPDVLMEQGLGWLETAGGALTGSQREAVDEFLPFLRGDKPWSDLTDDGEDAAGDDGSGSGGGSADDDEEDSGGGGDPGGFTGFVSVKTTAARAEDEATGESESPSIVSYYAAGIGVMFLLFSMAGAGGSLLEEEEQGTLERLLGSRVTMGRLLLGNWLFFAVVGIAQVTVMFLWGALVFGLDLWTAKHLAGFAAMTLVTGAAAAAFGIVLATLCRSRAQLGGLSTIIILIMSALGGSMVPRFVMPAFMNTTAKFTFNGWALDGYLKVFWYDDPDAGLLASLAALWPELLVLTALTVIFLLIARIVARRWEVV